MKVLSFNLLRMKAISPRNKTLSLRQSTRLGASKSMITFQPNCSFPSSSPSGFVNSPIIRSTTDIVWSCVTVLLLSTWSTLHLNLPPDLKVKSKLEELRKQIYLFGRKLGWMCVMLAFPEYFVGISTTNLFAAWVNHAHLKRIASEDDVEWSLTHTVLANIGGIAIRFNQTRTRKLERSISATASLAKASVLTATTINMADNSIKPVDTQDYVKQLERVEPLSLAPTSDSAIDSFHSMNTSRRDELPSFIHQFRRYQERHLQGLGTTPWKPFPPHISLAAHARPRQDWVRQNLKKYALEQFAPLQGNIWVLDSKQLVLARESGIITRLPSISMEEIEDKSKIDGFLRLISLFQASWFAIQLLARRVADVPSSALEISTVAFVACAVLIYIIEWPKPKDVGVPFYLDTAATISPAVFLLVAEASPITFLQKRHYYMAQSCVHQVIEGRFTKEYVDRMVVLVSILSITIYGGIHFFAWDLDFPTQVERLLWRISALTVTIAPAVSALIVLSENLVRHRTDKWSQWSVTVLAPVYLGARMYIMVESFRDLYYLPPQAFISTWVGNAPHIG